MNAGDQANKATVSQLHEALPPPDTNDLVVFIAKNKPNLYRVIGTMAHPWSQAQFNNPVSLIADPGQPCFYVLDRPQYIQEQYKIWGIRPDGSVGGLSRRTAVPGGGPLDNPVGIGLDSEGGLLLADSVTGVFGIQNDGSKLLFDGRDGPIRKITAAMADFAGHIYVGSSYMHEVTGGQMLNQPGGRTSTWVPAPGSGMLDATVGAPGVGNTTGRQVPIREWKNQGGLYRLDFRQNPPVTQLLFTSREGAAEHDTLWRDLRQVYIDRVGRVLLVDEGSEKKFRSGSYNTSTSTINGGVFLLTADGRLENLTFKTPDGNSGPLRRPRGICQWDENSYLIADPELYVPEVEGSGGLLLMSVEGRRAVHAAFGWRLKPYGIAILRQ